MWGKITDTQQGWMAASYLANFLVGLAIGAGELLGAALLSMGMP